MSSAWTLGTGFPQSRLLLGPWFPAVNAPLPPCSLSPRSGFVLPDAVPQLVSCSSLGWELCEGRERPSLSWPLLRPQGLEQCLAQGDMKLQLPLPPHPSTFCGVLLLPSPQQTHPMAGPSSKPRFLSSAPGLQCRVLPPSGAAAPGLSRATNIIRDTLHFRPGSPVTAPRDPAPI